jgi:5'-deoxynucleotidase YfbR-like HD superfamily hydrolase
VSEENEIAPVADALIRLGEMALAFGRVDRTAVFHPDGAGGERGASESDTDHTVMLGWAACAFAARFYPGRLDVGLVAQFALVHDAVEVYAGDTVTLRITSAERAEKSVREAVSADRIAQEFGGGAGALPWFPNAVMSYEAQVLPEARFVRALDKILPKLVHVLDGARGLVEQGMGRAELSTMLYQQRRDMRHYAGEFSELIHLHAEMSRRVLNMDELGD